MDYLNENINTLLTSFEDKLGKSASYVKAEFALVRAGRVNPALVERIMVEYFGTPTPLNQLGNISCADSRTIVINIWDTAIIREASKAITNANVGANPIDDGRVIRLIFPTLTEERRRELVKQIKKIAENGKIAMRNDRRDTLDKARRIYKEESISEDEQKTIDADIQKLLDNYVSSIDKLTAKKETEIMEI